MHRQLSHWSFSHYRFFKKLSKTKIFIKNHLLVKWTQGKGWRKRFLMFCLNDPRYCQPREFWHNWNLILSQLVESSSEGTHQTMQILDSNCLSNRVYKGDIMTKDFNSVIRVSGSQILNLTTYQLENLSYFLFYLKNKKKYHLHLLHWFVMFK